MGLSGSKPVHQPNPGERVILPCDCFLFIQNTYAHTIDFKLIHNTKLI